MEGGTNQQTTQGTESTASITSHFLKSQLFTALMESTRPSSIGHPSRQWRASPASKRGPRMSLSHPSSIHPAAHTSVTRLRNVPNRELVMGVGEGTITGQLNPRYRCNLILTDGPSRIDRVDPIDPIDRSFDLILFSIDPGFDSPPKTARRYSPLTVVLGQTSGPARSGGSVSPAPRQF